MIFKCKPCDLEFDTSGKLDYKTHALQFFVGTELIAFEDLERYDISEVRFDYDVNSPYHYTACKKCKKRVENKELIKYAKELIQPDDPRFRALYPKQHAEAERAKEATELKRLASEENKKDIYKKVCYNTVDEDVRKKVRDILDK